MFRSIIVFSFFIAIVKSFSIREMNNFEFLNFKEKYHKNYISENEEYNSYQIFNRNLDLIKYKNLNLKSYKLGINQFTDQTMDYIQSNILCSNFKLNTQNYDLSFLSNSSIKKNINWVKDGFVRPVKNQGSCGSCWAFSTTSALESMIDINLNQKILLSEQELVSCSKKNFGCNGGWMHKAMDYVKEKNGLFSVNDYSYIEKNIDCRTDILESKRIKSAGNFHYSILPSKSVDSLKNALTINPVCVAVKADFDFVFYKDGIFDKEIEENPSINHAILLIGMDNEKNYWTIQNSWGKEWGNNGFMDIFIKDKNGVAGINTYCVVPIFNK